MSTRGGMADEISALIGDDGLLNVRVTPGASRNALVVDGDRLAVRVTAIAEGGKANAAVQKLVARAMGCSRSDLDLIRGATARDKVFSVRL